MGINLMRVNERGKSIGALGRLYDDGTHGDASAGDGTFTGRFSFNEPNPVNIHLVVTIAYRGKLLRMRSPAFTISVRRRSASVERRPALRDQPDAAQTCETPRSRTGVNVALAAVASRFPQSLATEDSAMWPTMFVPSLAVSQNTC
jgi:hypothetical protein